MACTTSIGPGATNMVTAAAVAHVNRLPVLLLPGDVFANRRPDPVLQQVEQPPAVVYLAEQLTAARAGPQGQVRVAGRYGTGLEAQARFQNFDLAFLNDYGAPRYYRVGGCPWPGRRERLGGLSLGKTPRLVRPGRSGDR